MNMQMIDLARQQAEICKVFGNPNRVLILWALGSRELSVGDISDAIDSTLQNTSQHLRLMKDKGILSCRRDGHTIYYRVSDPRLVDAAAPLVHALQATPARSAPPAAERAPTPAR